MCGTCRRGQRGGGGQLHSADERIAESFEKDTGHKAKLAFGATGRFYAQIKNGAPFEVLLSADDETPAQARARGRRRSRQPLHLCHRQAGAVVQPGPASSTTKARCCGGARHGKLALANPKTAPYGAAAIEVLTKLGLLSAAEPKFVQGENIAQTYQFVTTGNAELGFVALSQVMKDGKIQRGSAWIVPADAARADPPGRGAADHRPGQRRGARPCWTTCSGDKATQRHPSLRLRALTAPLDGPGSNADLGAIWLTLRAGRVDDVVCCC